MQEIDRLGKEIVAKQQVAAEMDARCSQLKVCSYVLSSLSLFLCVFGSQEPFLSSAFSAVALNGCLVSCDDVSQLLPRSMEVLTLQDVYTTASVMKW